MALPLAHIKRRSAMATAGATLLTLAEAAETLRKSPAQIRWMVHRGTAPRSALIGGRRMFRQSDIEAYINQAFEDAA